MMSITHVLGFLGSITHKYMFVYVTKVIAGDTMLH